MGDRGDRGDRGPFVDGLHQTDDAEVVAVVLPHARAGRRVRPRSRHRAAPRLLRGARRRSRRRRRLRRHAALPALRRRACRYLEAGKHVLCEKPLALDQPAGRRAWSPTARANEPLPHGGDLEPLPARLPRARSGARRRAHRRVRARRGRLRVRRTVRSDPPPLRPRARRRGARSTSASTPCSSCTWCSARPIRCGRSGTWARPGSTSRWPRSCTTPAGAIGVVKAAVSTSMGLHRPDHGHRGDGSGFPPSCTARSRSPCSDRLRDRGHRDAHRGRGPALPGAPRSTAASPRDWSRARGCPTPRAAPSPAPSTRCWTRSFDRDPAVGPPLPRAVD